MIVGEGYDRVTIDAVAKRADVARSVVYGAYDNLDALLMALLVRQQTRAYERLTEAIPDPTTLRAPAAFAAEAILRMSAMLCADPDTWRLILLPPATMPPVVRDRIEADRGRFRHRVQTWRSLVLPDRGDPPLDPEISPTHCSPARNTSAAWP